MMTSSSAALTILLTSEVPPELHPALRLLVKAHGYAQDLGRLAWDFAVEIGVLHAAGCTNSDLRWLLAKGHVRHVTEASLRDEGGPAAQRRGRVRFSPSSCFFLSHAGVAPASATTSDGHPDGGRPSPPVPCWDSMDRALRWWGRLLKRYRQKAPNQEAVLGAFQEEGWPHRIDNPLPAVPGRDPYEQLHDTLRRLNHQRVRLLCFRTDGIAQAVFWEPRT